MRNRRLIVPLLLAVIALQGCDMFNIHRARRETTITSPHFAGSSLVVSSRNGAIEVIADPTLDEVIIEAVLTCGGATPAEAKERVADAVLVVERDTSSTLRVHPVFPGGPRNGDGCRIVVHVPDADGVNIDTGNGHVLARGMNGALVIDTSNGTVKVQNHQGETQIHTSNGRIELLGHDGPVNARTSNGRITLTLDPNQAGPITLKSSNGRIVANVGPAFLGRVEFDTSNGRIHVNGGNERISRERIRRHSGYIILDGEDDGPGSLLDTSNGSITLNIEP